MKKVMVVFGTRPEAIKMCPVVLELKKREQLNCIVCVTGQHRQMLDQVLNSFNIVPKYDLAIMSKDQTLFGITEKILCKMKEVLEIEKPDIVLVHGDTTTTFATALSAFYLNIPIGHVEAGLRTYNLSAPFPEEFNRQATGVIARYHFAPTEVSKDNLIKENKNINDIFVTGNTAIDALKTTVKNDFTHPILEWVGKSRLILLTAHRRENLGKPLENIFDAVKRIADEYEDIKVVYPIHMNPKIRATADKILSNHDRIKIIEPLDVLDFHNILAKSYLVLTDSGGIQEEAPSLGKPVLVMRDTTERPEGIKAGTLKLVGTDKMKIYHAINVLLNDYDEYSKMSNASNPYGDGKASNRIADIIESIE